MVKGIIITYKPKDSNSRTRLNHALYGRIVRRNYRNKKYAYYIPGLLENLKFYRLLCSKVFILTEYVSDDIVEELHESVIKNIEDSLKCFGEYTKITCDRNLDELALKTGTEYWECFAKEKNIIFKKRKNGRKNYK